MCVLLHAAETWTVPCLPEIKVLEAFYMKCQRRINQVKRQQLVRKRHSPEKETKMFFVMSSIKLGRF